MLSFTNSSSSYTIDLFVLCAAYGSFNICLQTHISKVSVLLLSSAFNVHASSTYKNTGNIRVLISLFLLSLTFHSLVMAEFFKAIRLCSSAKDAIQLNTINQ